MIDAETRVVDLDDDTITEKHAGRLPAVLHPKHRAQRPGRAPENDHHANRRRIRRAATGLAVDSGTGDVSLHLRLHGEGRGGPKPESARNRKRRSALVLVLLSWHSTLTSTQTCCANEWRNTGPPAGSSIPAGPAGRSEPGGGWRSRTRAPWSKPRWMGCSTTHRLEPIQSLTSRSPQSVPGVPEGVLNPRDTWANKNAYDSQGRRISWKI